MFYLDFVTALIFQMMCLINEYHSGFSRGSEMSLPCCVVCTECCLCTNRSFEPPKRDEERETERKLKAKRARESRRSTQVRIYLVVYDSRMRLLVNPIYSLDHWIKYLPTTNIDGLVQERRNSSALAVGLTPFLQQGIDISGRHLSP